MVDMVWSALCSALKDMSIKSYLGCDGRGRLMIAVKSIIRNGSEGMGWIW